MSGISKTRKALWELDSGNVVRAFSLRSDGKRLAVASGENLIIAYLNQDNSVENLLNVNASALLYSPDGKLLAIGDDEGMG